MAKKDRNILKSYFETGDIPTEGQYSNLIDSFAILNSENTGSLDVNGDITATRFIGDGSLITGITSSLININSSTLSYSSGSLLISGNLYYTSGSSNVLLGIRTTGSILPGGNNIWDLGSPTQYFRSVYVNNIYTGDIVGSNVSFGNITSSGNISSNSNITANNFTGIFNGALSSSAQISTNISGAFVLTSASIASNVASNLNNINTNTSNISTLNSSGLLSSSAQITTNISGAFTLTSASISTNIASNLVSINTNTSNISTLNSSGLLSSSAQIATNISGAFTITSASLALDIVNNAANTFKQTGVRTGDSILSGSLIIRSTGATNPGDANLTIVGGGSPADDATLSLRQNLATAGYAVKYDGGLDHFQILGNNESDVHLSIQHGDGRVRIPGIISSSDKVYHGGLAYGTAGSLVTWDSSTGELKRQAIAGALAASGIGLLSSSNQIASNISGAIDAATGSLLSSYTFLSSSAQIATDISGAFTSTSASLASDIVNNAANTFKSTGQRNGNSFITGSLHLTGSTSDLRVDGTVGIGVAAPSAIESSPPLQTVLHVKSNHAGNDPAVLIEGVNAADNAALRLKNADEQWTLSNAGSSYSDSFLIRSESAVNGNSYPFMISKTATGPDQFHPLVHLNSTKLSVLAKFNDTTAANLLVSGNMTLLGPNGHITASGNISASGNIQSLTSASFSTRLTTAETELEGTLISSSAQLSLDISGSFTSTSASFSTRITTTETELGNTLLSSSAQIASNISGALSKTAIAALNGGYYSSSLQTLGNITSSGNIIATGNISASNISASALVEGIGFRTSGNSAFGGQLHVGGTTTTSFNTGQIFKATGTSEFTGDITGSSKLLIQRSNGQGNPDEDPTNSSVAIFQHNDNSNDASIAIIAADTKASMLHFGKHDDIDVGSIKYFHDGHSSNDQMKFKISGSNVVTFNNVLNRGSIGIGGDFIPADYFHAQGVLSGGGLTVSSSNGGTILLKAANTRAILDRTATDKKLNIEFNTAGTTNWTLGNIAESNDNFYIYSGDATGDKHISLTSDSTTFHTNVTASNNISASGNIYSTNITAVSGAFSYITASIIDVDANTIRLGGSPFSKSDVDSLRGGKMPEQTPVEGFTNRLQPEAIFGKHDNDYIKFTIGNRIGTFISGTLFQDMNLTGSNNYFAVGKDSNTQLILTGQITASSHISASGNIYSTNIESIDTISTRGGTGIFGIDSSEQPRVIIRGGHITASGNISSSGNLSATGDLDIDGVSHFAGHITSSGNISASGNITADTLISNNIIFTPSATSIKIEAPDELSGNISGAPITIESGDAQGSNYNGGDITLQTGKGSGAGDGGNLILNTGKGFPSGSILMRSKNLNIDSEGHITASGHISSSNASTASFGSMILTNLPTTIPTTTGSLWLSGSNAEGTSKYLMVFTG